MKTPIPHATTLKETIDNINNTLQALLRPRHHSRSSRSSRTHSSKHIDDLLPGQQRNQAPPQRQASTPCQEDERLEPTPICMQNDIVPILCEDESHLAHLSENDCESSDYTPICEIECFHLEDMSDTPIELREVVDRSMEATWHANKLPSTTSVFSHVVGSMDDDAPVTETFHLVDDEDAIPIDDETPIMAKIFMVHQDDDITPCLHEDDD